MHLEIPPCYLIGYLSVLALAWFLLSNCGFKSNRAFLFPQVKVVKGLLVCLFFDKYIKKISMVVILRGLYNGLLLLCSQSVQKSHQNSAPVRTDG